MDIQLDEKKAHIEMLYRQYGQLMFRRARAFLKNSDEAWDVVQEVFKRLLTFADRLDLSQETHRYLYRCTTNAILAHCNQKKKQRSLSEHWENSLLTESSIQEDRSLGQRLAQLDLRALRLKLKPEDWELLHYRFAEGLSTAEIGEIFSISSRGIRKRLHKLSLRLKQIEQEENRE